MLLMLSSRSARNRRKACGQGKPSEFSGGTAGVCRMQELRVDTEAMGMAETMPVSNLLQ